jgi:hypothetical protein
VCKTTTQLKCCGVFIVGLKLLFGSEIIEMPQIIFRLEKTRIADFPTTLVEFKTLQNKGQSIFVHSAYPTLEK